MVAGKTPFTPRIEPSSASSPIKSALSTTSSIKLYSFPRIPSAIGRS